MFNRNRHAAVAAIALFLCLLTSAWGQVPSAPKKLQDFDIRELSPAADTSGDASLLGVRAILARRAANMAAFTASARTSLPGVRITASRFGVPQLMVRDGLALTHPSTADPEDIARLFLRSNASLFPFAAREIDQLRVLVRDVTPEVTHLAFNQTLNGVNVFEGQIKFTLSRSGEVIQVATGGASPELTVSTTPALGSDDAERFARRLVQAPAATLMRAPELVIFPINAGSARLAWRILIETDRMNDYEVVLDANQGGLLYRHGLNVFAQARVWQQSPSQGSRIVVALPDAWLDDPGTTTTGNNIDAFIDADGDDNPDSGTIADMQNSRPSVRLKTSTLHLATEPCNWIPGGLRPRL